MLIKDIRIAERNINRLILNLNKHKSMDCVIRFTESPHSDTGRKVLNKEKSGTKHSSPTLLRSLPLALLRRPLSGRPHQLELRLPPLLLLGQPKRILRVTRGGRRIPRHVQRPLERALQDLAPGTMPRPRGIPHVPKHLRGYLAQRASACRRDTASHHCHQRLLRC